MKFLNKNLNLFFVLTVFASFPLMASESSSSASSETPEHKVSDTSQFEFSCKEIFSDANKVPEISKILKENKISFLNKELKETYSSQFSLEKEVSLNFMGNERFTEYSPPPDSLKTNLVDFDPLTPIFLSPPEKGFILRGGIKLPSIDFHTLGLNKFFENYGVDIGFDVRFSLRTNLRSHFLDNEFSLLNRLSFISFDQDIEKIL